MAGPWEDFAAKDDGPWNDFAGAKKDAITIRPVGEKRPDIGQGRAALEGALQGASANFSDEIYAASKASGLPEVLGGFRAPVGAARLAYEGLTGQNDPKYAGSLPDVLGVPAPEEPPKRGEATKIYEEKVAEKRQLLKDAAEQYPKTFIASELAGGLALPLGSGPEAAVLAARAAKAATMEAAPRVLYNTAVQAGDAAKVGAAYGVAGGAGSGEGAADTAVKAGIGGIAGGTIGGVASPVMQGIGAGVGAVTERARGMARAVIDPEKEALRQFGGGIMADARVDPQARQRLTPTEMLSNDTAVLGDMGGPVTRRIADTAAIIHPETGAKLSQTLGDRTEGQYSRITDWLKSNFNYPNATLQKEAIQDMAKGVNNDNYRRAMTEGANGVWSPELQRLAGAPSIQDAARQSMQSLKDRGITEGFRAPRSMPLEFNPETGIATLAKDQQGATIIPDLRFWDQVKRHLDARINSAEAKGDTETVGRLTGLKNNLVSELDKQVKSYASARAGAAHFFGEENALDAGAAFVTGKFDETAARKVIGDMKPNERQLFQDGFLTKFVDMLGDIKDRRNILNKIADSPNAQKRLEMVMGKDKYAEFDTKLRIEGIQQLAKDAIQGNSWTARRLADLGMFTGGKTVGSLMGVDGTYKMDPKEMAIGVAIAALASGGKFVDKRVAQKLGEMFMSKDPILMDRALKLVSNNSNMRQNLIQFDKRIVASGAERPAGAVPQIAGPQSINPAAAQENQPGIPGPI